jgi:hypothetical protein
MFIAVFTPGVISFTHLTLLQLIILATTGEQYEPCGPSLYNLLHPPVTLTPSRPNTSLRTVLSLTVRIVSSTARYQATGRFTATQQHTIILL